MAETTRRVFEQYEVRKTRKQKTAFIEYVKSVAESYGYEQLTFYEGAIEDYDGIDQVDMVITLHACDTATDHAIYKAIHWGADVILSVPCCPHELNSQLKIDFLSLPSALHEKCTPSGRTNHVVVWVQLR